MTKINCSVSNCSHNKSNICYSNIVNITGGSAKESCSTCCGNFLDVKNYSTLTNNTNACGPCDALVCTVKTCVYNRNLACTAENISVNGSNANIYTETSCSTFKYE